jgi:hypothetical protein
LQHGAVATLLRLFQLLFQPAVLLAEHIDLLLQRSPLLEMDKWNQREQ